jgi:hypothetical protein
MLVSERKIKKFVAKHKKLLFSHSDYLQATSDITAPYNNFLNVLHTWQQYIHAFDVLPSDKEKFLAISTNHELNLNEENMKYKQDPETNSKW